MEVVLTVKLTVSVLESKEPVAEMAVPFPAPGSVSIKYSAAVIVCQLGWAITGGRLFQMDFSILLSTFY